MTYVERNDGLVWAYAAFLTLALALLVLSGTTNQEVVGPVLGALGMVALAVLTLSGLSVAVDGGQLSLWLGPGFFRRRYAVADILTVRHLPRISPFAVGLRLLPDGWLYSLGSSDFIELRFRDGTRLLIGAESTSPLAEHLHRVLSH